MGIQAREGGFVPEVKRLTARGAGPLTAYLNQSPAPKETEPQPAMAEAAAWCANPWREIGTVKTNHESGDLFRASLVVRSAWRFMRPFSTYLRPVWSASRTGLFHCRQADQPNRIAA